MLWEDGAYYIGNFKNNESDGHGRLIHYDGDIYDG